jgi:hypothetical protein
MTREESAPSGIRNWLIAVSVLATLGIMLILMQRFGAIDVPFLRGAAGSPTATHGSGPDGALVPPAAADPTAALIDSLRREVEVAKHTASVHTASTPTTLSEPAHRVAERRIEPTSSETPVPPTLAASAPDSPATGTTSDAPHYGVGVAAYLDEDRARTEGDRLSHDTTLPATLLPFQEAGTTMYRVVLGRWSTTSDAERAANALMDRGLINEAHVVAIPRR